MGSPSHVSGNSAIVAAQCHVQEVWKSMHFFGQHVATPAAYKFDVAACAS
jgi:hypothetical protein